MIKRRELAGRAAIGLDVSECVLCGAMIANRAMDRHIAKSCPARLVSCQQCGIRLVAKRRKRHEEEWCEAPNIVRLRGLAVRARKLRAYEREWSELELEDA